MGMQTPRDPRFTGILLFAGLWNIGIATWALMFTATFIQLLGLEGRGNMLSIGQQVFWATVGVSGVLFIVSALNNARLRFFIAIAVPGKIVAFVASLNVFLTGQAGAGILLIGVGDLLFTLPFILYLRATRHLGWL